jgi:uncharacterized protein
MGQKLSGRVQRRFLDTNSLTAAGAFVYAENTGRYLWLLRNRTSSAGHWAFPGGKLSGTETVFQGLLRELTEELGSLPDFRRIIPLEKFTSWNSRFVYYNFWIQVPDEFEPRLNTEHSAYQWCSRVSPPSPAHELILEMLDTPEIVQKLVTAESQCITVSR